MQLNGGGSVRHNSIFLNEFPIDFISTHIYTHLLKMEKRQFMPLSIA
jgi:hypothetical protein